MTYSQDNFPGPDWTPYEVIIGCLDRIIELLESNKARALSFTPEYFNPPSAVTCPKCGDGGMLGIAQDAIVCGTCGYSWRESFPL